ncbi:SCO1/SenC family protein [Parvularcula bermudensis HTCC2503]|uniref:SCO1/SenC family protein n=1 Tax=Parvularcula bermudensis (strain ATCC BAA-594 / HTCC2503 / KCTC 12087) TaxID=314260 RepID=E0TEQ8_PARBH|nr:SCO family protein [Parvularcula bermudensis]ADM08941.1 SCO1/SenC family protein [Parvularcula bermudensis HTCC2503]
MIRPIALVLTLTLMACGQAPNDRPMPGAITLNEAFDADFDLIDDQGEPATDERFEGKPMFIYFGFTACPDICPAALGIMTQTLDRLGAQSKAIQPLFISVDPARDDPERLRNHLAYDGRILGLTGSQAAIDDARLALNYYAARRELPDSALGYTIDHQRIFFLTDAAGTPVLAFPDSTDPALLAKAIRRILSE